MSRQTTSSSETVSELHNYIPFFQPQYNYDTGEMIGAEVLARRVREDGTYEGPSNFVGDFEKSGFIYEMDKHIWKLACMNLSRWKAAGYPIQSLSVNVSRKDLYHADMPDYLRSLLSQYGVEKKSIHLEITETGFSEDPQQLNDVLTALRSEGFVIEMDDFGSGYSSLCALMDLPIDTLKMDSDFLSSSDRSHRRGRIVTSIIQMAHAIDMYVIAEGVENKNQADFLKSVGCLRMQGFLFAPPMDAEAFEDLLKEEAKKTKPVNYRTHEQGVPNSLDFFDIESLSTLVFNSYVGGAAILSRGSNGKVSAIRINDKFFEIIGLRREDFSGRQYDIASILSEEDTANFTNSLDEAVKCGRETNSLICVKNIDGKNREFWSYNRVRFLSSKRGCQFFYLNIEDVTEKVKLNDRNIQLLKAIKEREDIFMHAAEQVNMFFWKYDIAEKVIFPCFRCQMILGVPARLENYPDSAIEMCIFPEGERYRRIMKKVDAGQDIDEIMLLTSEKLPFRVRYTVERDKDGKPSVAYATAIPVVS